MHHNEQKKEEGVCGGYLHLMVGSNLSGPPTIY